MTSDHNTNYENDDDNFFPLTKTDKSRLYSPWQFFVIVKVFGKTIGHQILRNKITSLWKSAEVLPLIDLGFDFFLIKLQNKENMHKALHRGPCFILNHFLSVRKWEPKFIASNTQLAYSALWVRLPELPHRVL